MKCLIVEDVIGSIKYIKQFLLVISAMMRSVRLMVVCEAVFRRGVISAGIDYSLSLYIRFGKASLKFC